MQPVPVRIGGFGGAQGLAEYIRNAKSDILIDATHPYASVISANAARAALMTEIAFVALRRPPWTGVAGDRWCEVADEAEAVQMLGTVPRRVFLALGGKALAAFVSAPQHRYLVRSIDPVKGPARLVATYITGRGPFAEGDEAALLQQHHIDILVSRNSGGIASYGKIAAARALGLPVILLRRPVLPDMPAVASVADAMAWLDQVQRSAVPRGV